MGLFGKKLEPKKPETVEEVLSGAYGILKQLEYVEEVNIAKSQEAREKAEDLREKAQWQDNEANDREAKADHANEVLGNFKQLLGQK